MSLRWPERASLAIARFFRGLQDVEVFVEDTAAGSCEFYTELFRRILCDDGFRITRVFTLGGRLAVEQACRESLPGRPRLFVVDGDLDLLTGEGRFQSRKLHILGKYCIENYLFCQIAASQLLQESVGGLAADEARRRLRWPVIRSDLEVLVEMFVAFAVAKSLGVDTSSTGRGLGSVLSGGGRRRGRLTIDRSKVRGIVESVRKQIAGEVGADALESEWGRVSARVEASEDPLDYVSGKHFILPFLRIVLGKLSSGLRADERSFRFRLARHCDLSHFDSLRNQLRGIAGGG